MKRNNLEYKPVPEFPAYFACSNGKIYSLKNNIKKKSSGDIKPGDNNYRELTSYLSPGSKFMSVNLTRDKEKISFNVHKLIGWAFTGKSPFRYCFVHKRKNYLNNRPDNLEFFPLEFTDENENKLREIELKELESEFRRSINYDYNSKIWKQYEVLKLKGNLQLRLNFLRVYLRIKVLKR